MSLRPEWVFLFGVIPALWAPRPLWAQATGVATKAERSDVSVPFVGCASSGQIEVLEAPKGISRSVPMCSRDAQKLAYYKSADGIGLLAPRGWYCAGASGSGGSDLYLSPKPIHNTLSGLEGLKGPVIEISRVSGENSARFEVAEIIARVFPEHRAFASRVLEGFDFPVPSGPYPKDTLTYSGKQIVEYKTPARTEGLGTSGSLKKNDTPIVGAAILIIDPTDPIGNPPSVVLLCVSFPAALAKLTPVIVRCLEREVLGVARN